MSEEKESNTAEAENQPDLAEAMKKKDWKKILFVVLLTITVSLEVIYLVPLLVIISVAFYLLKGEVDERVAKFSDSLVAVIAGSLSFIMFRSEDKPWPLASWPGVNDASDDNAVEKKPAEGKKSADAGE